MNKSRATYLDMALIVCPANLSVQFLCKSGMSGRSEMRQDQEDKVFHQPFNVIFFFLFVPSALANSQKVT